MHGGKKEAVAEKTSNWLYVIGAGSFLAFTASSTWGPFPLAFAGLNGPQFFQAGCATQISYVLSFFGVAAIAYHRPDLSRKVLFLCMSVLLTSSMSILLLQHTSTVSLGSPVVIISGIFLGSGTALAFMQWTEILAQKKERTAKEVLLKANVYSILLIVLLVFIPEDYIYFVVAFLLLPFVLVFTWLNIRSNAIPKNKQKCTENYNAAAKELVVPLVCTAVFFLSGTFAALLWSGSPATETARMLISQGAGLVSVLLLFLCWFVWKMRISISQLYVILLPILLTVFLVNSFILVGYKQILTFICDSCFILISIMMVITCIETARRFRVNNLVVYGVFGGIAYASRAPSYILMSFQTAYQVSFEIDALVMALFLIYLLTIPAFFIIRKLAGKRDMLTKSDEDFLNEKCQSMKEEFALSKRQAELLDYLARGRDVPYIAEALCLSKFTVRTYKKSLYAILGVHTQQELISLVEKRSDNETSL